MSISAKYRASELSSKELGQGTAKMGNYQDESAENTFLKLSTQGHKVNTSQGHANSSTQQSEADLNSEYEVFAFGLILPRNYHRGPDSNFSWICPVASCQQRRSTQKALAKHWMTTHCHDILNNNSDGTFSIVGHQADNLEEKAVVVANKHCASINKMPVTPSQDETIGGEAQSRIRRSTRIRLKTSAGIQAPSVPRAPVTPISNRGRKKQTVKTPHRSVAPPARRLSSMQGSSIVRRDSHFPTASAPTGLSSPLEFRRTQRIVRSPELGRPSDLLEMEDWEVAPGRVSDVFSLEPSNIAFSASYLNSTRQVSVHSNVGFHNLVLKPGSVHQWSAVSNRVRFCSVASGKVMVKTALNEFTIGPNGMFKVLPDEDCKIFNRLYVDATIHVCVVDET